MTLHNITLSVYQPTQQHMPEDCYLNIQICENVKSLNF